MAADIPPLTTDNSPTPGQVRHEMRGDGIRESGAKDVYALQVAKVTRVDPVRLTMDIVTFTGSQDTYKDMNIGLAHAGARHFIGAIPQVGDLCVIGLTPAESGSTGRAYVVSWLIPGPIPAYDWTPIQGIPPTNIGLSPKLEVALSGVVQRTRHKLSLLDEGNVFLSSAQGADVRLDESVLISNRRGNEVLLRDQDQAIVMRSLQQFHAGAGFRVYAGMVQRDSEIPSQMFGDSVNWTASQQIDDNDNPLSSAALEANPTRGYLTPADVFARGTSSTPVVQGLTIPEGLDPYTNLRRGGYITTSNLRGSTPSVSTALYGGKSIYRVGTTGDNAAAAPATAAWSEYRIEVAHTADGTLPVTEQTDGFDVDRLLPSPPSDTKTDPSNRSENAPLVEMVLGTAVGNDPFKEIDTYRKPLKVKRGKLVVAEPHEVEDHLAFLIKVRNPVDPKAPPSFLAITKGGAWKKSFRGRGSPSSEDFFEAGHSIEVGKNEDGTGLGVVSEGSINLINTGGGDATTNAGVNIISEAGAVIIRGSGASTEGAGQGVGTDAGDSTLAAQAVGLLMTTDRTLLQQCRVAKVKAQTFTVDDNDTSTFNTNTQFSVRSGGGVGFEGKAIEFQSNGSFKIGCGGPPDGVFLKGQPFDLSTMANPATGFPGGAAASFTSLFGNLINAITTTGQYVAKSQAGGCSLGSFGVPAIVPAIPLPGITCSFGPVPGVGASNMVGPAGAVSTAFQGIASMTALAGAASITSALAAMMTASTQAMISGPRVSVFCAGIPGAVLTDGCFDSLTGFPFIAGGTIGTPGFRVNS